MQLQYGIISYGIIVATVNIYLLSPKYMIAEYYRIQEKKEKGKEREKSERQLHFNCLNFTLKFYSLYKHKTFIL